MATHYKGERISDLLQRIEELKAILDENAHLEPDPLRIVSAYADLAIAKAKFTALKGENND
jgi:NifU-like protein involved in Fe-S cluster formation